MCDCYMHKCESCDNLISVHIADYCTARESVKVYCPDCLHTMPDVDHAKAKVFLGKSDGDVFAVGTNKPRRKYNGKTVLFIVEDVHAYGIELN